MLDVTFRAGEKENWCMHMGTHRNMQISTYESKESDRFPGLPTHNTCWGGKMVSVNLCHGHSGILTRTCIHGVSESLKVLT